MKKYHIADVLTWTRVIFAICLILATVFGWPPELAIVFFVVGELSDAFDGMAARKWPYPDDGKKRWWREYIKIIEPASDISLGVAVLLYILFRVSLEIGAIILCVGAFIGLYVQFRCYGGIFRKITTATNGSLFRTNPERARELVLFRRTILYVGAIIMVILTLLWALEIPFMAKLVLTTIGALAGMVLWVVKRDRRTEVETD